MAFIVYYAKNLVKFLDDIKELGFLGNLIMILSYFPAGLPFALVSYYVPLSLSAGFIYGPFKGIATTMVGSVSSGVFGFWVTRAFCRAWIEEKIKSSARLSALLLSMEVHSFKITLMLRFLPLPFGLQNGLCAMTSITPQMYLIASIIGLLPENILLIYFGNGLGEISEIAKGDKSGSYSSKILLVVAILVTVIIVVLGRKMLNATLAAARMSNKKTEDIELESDKEEKMRSISEMENGGGYDEYAEKEELNFESPSPLKLTKVLNMSDPPPYSSMEEKRNK